ncbi:MAG: ThiJ/PfpI domain protein [Rhodospirillales bacterium]|nr:ThiJ/PfpI domain protein [Rhodospirillales bacterium]
MSAKRSDGRSLVDGKRVNSFTNSEEKAVGLTEVVPFLLETRLRELGGRFEGGPEWQPFAVRDGNLITGQNPMSSELVARRVIDALETQEVA